ncbi:MAG: hypothetical protein M3177_01145 [Pseudomonadota bacterium]|nr:hypothetical protein [Pseudomonadota bacterium]
MNASARNVWDRISGSKDEHELRDFCETFPGTEEAFLAKRRLTEIKKYQDMVSEYHNCEASVRETVQREGYKWNEFTIDRVTLNMKVIVAERFLKENPEHPEIFAVSEMLEHAKRDVDEFKRRYPNGY